MKSKPRRGLDPGVDEHLVSLVAPGTFEAEQYRALRHAVEQLRRTADLQVVAVSSPTVGDGKTTTAINLAGALAQGPKARTVLVEADLRVPSVAHQLGDARRTRLGLVDAILDTRITLDDIVETQSAFNLSFICAGQVPTMPYEVLKSPRLGELLDELRQRFDYVVVDTPPLVSVQDCRVIAHRVDGFLLVVAAHRTPRALVEEALTVMDPEKMIGLVFNRDDRRLPDHYSRYYYPRQGQAGPVSGKDRSAGTITRILTAVGGSFGSRAFGGRVMRRSDRTAP